MCPNDLSISSTNGTAREPDHIVLEDIELELARTLDLVLEERAWIGEDGGGFIAWEGETHPFGEMLEGEDVLDGALP